MAKKTNPPVVQSAVQLPVTSLVVNDGQIPGVPANPRFIKDDRFAALVVSLRDDPEFMSARPLLVYPLSDSTYVVIGGNMRLQGCRQLKWETVPCWVIPASTPAEKLRAYVIKDNQAFGQDDWDKLSNEWDHDELKAWGMITPADWDDNDPEPESNSATDEGWWLNIKFTSEQECQQWYEKLQAEGLLCRIVQ